MKGRIKIILSLIVLGGIAAVLVYIFYYNKPHPDIEKLAPAYSLNASELYNSFINDRKGSEMKYNGRVVEVKGNLAKIEANDSSVTAVFVFNQGMFGDEGIRCSMLKKYRDEVKSLVPQSEVKIKGFCSGFNDTDVILEQACILK